MVRSTRTRLPDKIPDRDSRHPRDQLITYDNLGPRRSNSSRNRGNNHPILVSTKPKPLRSIVQQPQPSPKKLVVASNVSESVNVHEVSSPRGRPRKTISEGKLANTVKRSYRDLDKLIGTLKKSMFLFYSVWIRLL